MDKSVFSFVDKRLNAETAVRSRRYISAGADGLSLAVLSETGEVWALQAWNFQGVANAEQQVRMLMGQEPALQYSFGLSKWAWAEPQVTLVPRRLFHADHLADYFKILLPPGGSYQYSYESLPIFDCYLVYAVDTSLYSTAVAPQHLSFALLQAFHHLADYSDHQIFVHFRFQSLQIAVFERRNLLFFNSFQFQHANDALYFILLAYEQFKLDPLELPLLLSGNLVEDSEIFRLLKRYFRNIRFVPLPSSVQLPQSAVELPAHYWFDVFSLI
jgi:hypothetical protein